MNFNVEIDVEDDIYIKMPPVKERTVRVKVKNVEKGKLNY